MLPTVFRRSGVRRGVAVSAFDSDSSASSRLAFVLGAQPGFRGVSELNGTPGKYAGGCPMACFLCLCQGDRGIDRRLSSKEQMQRAARVPRLTGGHVARLLSKRVGLYLMLVCSSGPRNGGGFLLCSGLLRALLGVPLGPPMGLGELVLLPALACSSGQRWRGGGRRSLQRGLRLHAVLRLFPRPQVSFPPWDDSAVVVLPSLLARTEMLMSLTFLNDSWWGFTETVKEHHFLLRPFS